ncbi:hypothetical protein MCU_00714 [Bartonella elizabethae Re6043vi]|uniref:Uncharacterized protein n=2 Tax=Bartonella elizabethae TaxID=807 RepID=J1A4S0_BAREL|nr:hypothetical protein MCU_00714 [Bartonella elizabethae Re6043vi]EJF96713.1 hypothetical protein MEE_00612 [Bartonella elizabethae F9251 = ATCC 49927]VEJ40186.1 Uncharacterised protein [Bartonella elizabethae]
MLFKDSSTTFTIYFLGQNISGEHSEQFARIAQDVAMFDLLQQDIVKRYEDYTVYRDAVPLLPPLVYLKTSLLHVQPTSLLLCIRR